MKNKKQNEEIKEEIKEEVKENKCNCGEDCDCDDECHCDESEILIQELQSRLLREKADNINYRKRKDEEVLKMLKYSNEDIIVDLLPTIDNFERAIKLDDTNLNDELSKFLAGFKMIYCNLTLAIEKAGVKQIDGANKPFDPTYHQAILTEKVEGIDKDNVLEVLQKGYMYKDKLIRPAMVMVSE